MILLASGRNNDLPFLCTLNLDTDIKQPEEAIQLLMKKRRVYRDWLEVITVLSFDGSEENTWSLASGDWTN